MVSPGCAQVFEGDVELRPIMSVTPDTRHRSRKALDRVYSTAHRLDHSSSNG
jgi:hypothetical protein